MGVLAAGVWAVQFCLNLPISDGLILAGPGPSEDEIARDTAAATKEARAKSDHFVLMFTGNWQNRLEPCGCAQNMLGGIDRRSHILGAVDPKQRLLLDIGTLISDERPQNLYAFETFLYSLRQLRYDAITLTPPEMQLILQRGIMPEEIPPLLVSNAVESAGPLPLLPSLEKPLTAGKHHLSTLTIALPQPDENTPPADIDLIDPAEAVITTLQAHQLEPHEKRIDKLVIVLLPDEDEKLRARLTEIQAIDLIVTIAAYDTPEFFVSASQTASEESSQGPALLTVGNQGKYIARLDIPADQVERIRSEHFRYVPIKPTFRQDRQIVDLMQEYLDRLRIEGLIEKEILPREPLPDGNMFIGSQMCRSCHQVEYDTWKKMRHARAMTTLQERKNPSGRDFDPTCVVCHSVGMDYAGGYRSMQETPEMAHVGCEMCHGPGGNHVFSANPASVPMSKAFTRCADCHDSENDPYFEKDYEKKFQIIKHWDGKRSEVWHTPQ